MANLSVEKLATVIGSEPELLLSQIQEAGLSHSKVSDEVTDADKKILLDFLKNQQSKTSKTISLNKKEPKPKLKESGSVAITRKKVNRDLDSSSLEEKTKKTSSSIDFEEIEKKRVAGENQKRLDEENKKQSSEQKTLVTRRKAKSKESPAPARDITQVVKSKKPLKKAKSELTKKEQRELEGESFLSNVEKQEFEKPSEFISKTIQIPESLTVSELAQNLSIKGAEVVKKLMSIGVMATLNQTLDQDTAILVTEELGHKGEPAEKLEVEDKLMELVQYEGNEEKRNPVVSVLGHVDHGKTTLLDYIRKANVAEGEEGGITQKIGAYQANTESGTIAFIDTPGHAAFSEVRARGANSTDIVVLVVAADDGVKPQTVESIKHAKAANVPIVVAINKCDLPETDPQKIKNQLLEYELIAEDLSGDTLMVEISAKKKLNLDKLIEAIVLQSEILDLKTDFDSKATGVVLESKIDVGRGPVATIIVTTGTLKKGDYFVSGLKWGKVRAIINDKGKNINEALPSTPVEILGINGASKAGDDFIVLESEKEAKTLSGNRAQEKKDGKNPLTFATQESAFTDKSSKELNMIIKSDVHGSSEAIKNAINQIKHEEVKPKIILADIGMITETDVTLAKASNAVLIAFNVKPSKEAKKLAENENIKISSYNIIYEVLDYIKQRMSGLLAPDITETIIGTAQILEIFKVSGAGKVAGSKVTDGEILSSSDVRIIRDGSIIFTGKIGSIFREKNQVKQVASGQECGITVKDYIDFKKNDTIEAFSVKSEERSI